VLADLWRVCGWAECKVRDVLADVADRVERGRRRAQNRAAESDRVARVLVESLGEGRDLSAGVGRGSELRLCSAQEGDHRTHRCREHPMKQ
jgi:hypothetical protein